MKQAPNSVPNGRNDLPKPFIKWAGGKGQLVPQLSARVPQTFGAYHEPFMGGAALFWALNRAGRLGQGQVVLSDVNQELVDTYRAVRDQVEEVIGHLKAHHYQKEHYYEVRALDPRSLHPAQRAARMIYLNKTGFNGLYRVNQKGKFNVPFGSYKEPNFCDKPNLRAAAQALEKVEIRCEPFHTVLDRAAKGDFVYFDPPYVPLSDTANFVSYAQDGFNEGDQLKLCQVFTELHRRGVAVMLSNSDTPWVQEHYREFPQLQVQVRRSVNSRKDRRGPVSELVVLGRQDQE